MFWRVALLLSFAALASGCIVRTAIDVATAPVKIVSKTVDAATTSQSEADEARGREIRRREEQLGKLQREYDEQAHECEDGSDRACRKAVMLRSEMDALVPGIPVEPER